MDDCGGGYSESIAEICEELQNGSVNILCATPNGRSESGANRDCFLLNPLCTTKLHQNMFKLLGTLIGQCITQFQCMVQWKAQYVPVVRCIFGEW